MNRRKFLLDASATAASVVIAANVPKAVIEAGAYVSEQPAWVPQGWMLCDGRALLKAQCPALYAVLGGQYGRDDMTFRLPDLTTYASYLRYLVADGTINGYPAGMLRSYFRSEMDAG